MKVISYIAVYIHNYDPLGCGKDFFSHYKSMGANDPWGMASLDPRGLIGRIYVVGHYTLLHTKYISSGPHGFREEDYLSFSNYKSMGANDP